MYFIYCFLPRIVFPYFDVFVIVFLYSGLWSMAYRLLVRRRCFVQQAKNLWQVITTPAYQPPLTSTTSALSIPALCYINQPQ